MAEQEKEKLKEGSEEIKASQEGPEDCADSAAQETAEDERDCAEKENEEDAREEETASSGSSESGMTWAEKKAAKKQAKMDKKADSYKEKIDQLEDRVKRQMAEFENFRKRTDREKQAMFETGAKSVIEKILPVVDNFE